MKFPVLFPSSIIFIFVSIIFAEVLTHANPNIKIPLGKLQGKYLKSRDGKTYSAFLGIPYAEPPKRFQASIPVKRWEGEKNATIFGNKCLQGSRGGFPKQQSGSEDCLYLNVYTPDVNFNFPSSFAVLVYFHGGAFMFRSADEYGGEFYMDENVVLVTLNYRLGALGFLSTGDGVISGNFGLKDQNLALRWLQENIESFGGDKDKVTIFGASAGAASVSYHILSPQSKGLFRAAISQSGSALNPWAFVVNPREATFELANKIGCPTDDSERLTNCLREKTAHEIIEAQNSLPKWNMDPIAPFAPTIEVPSAHAFLTESPITILNEGRFNQVPWLVTAMKDEGQVLHAAAVIYKDNLRQELNKDWERLAPITFEYDDIGLSQENKSSISDAISKFYFDGKQIEKSSQQNLSDLYSHRWFVHGIQKAALLHAKHSPVYAGIFGYHGFPSTLPFVGVPAAEEIVTHGDDVKFHFPSTIAMAATDSRTQEAKDAQEKTSKRLVKLWVDFASDSSLELKINDVTWSKITSDEIETGSLKWMLLDEKPKILSGIFDKAMKFWDDLLDKFIPVKITNTNSTLNDEL